MTTYTIQYLTISAAAAALKEDKLVILTETTTARTLLLTDASKYIRCTNSGAISITVPPQASVAFPSPTKLIIEKSGTGNITLIAGSGVTLNSASGLVISPQFGRAELTKTSTDVWTVTLLPGTGGGSGSTLPSTAALIGESFIRTGATSPGLYLALDLVGNWSGPK